ncbi:ankyrin repeat and MYND domain-containing protein 2-like isoform X2 [Anneissia japonica]|uniref:ankyrin repeat and MYND domain-containing protein 2-like isoform X2 n=1 Tax=Anneissia japonica TaxID=1529436 RepID=UPI001425B471|nr:ankyrin repeat and MYND domain-containing protein 2-like isoform X2 [Anneissia japonica]
MTAPKPELCENEKLIFKNIESGNVDMVRSLLNQPDVRIDALDEHGMTPLQHAAFKGSHELLQLFLAHGADVNNSQHENAYTALMFAAISGHQTITKLLLEAGAKTTSLNSVGRTAAQMAAFVGQHTCVSIINNFFSRDKLEYYTIPHGFEKEPKLSPHLSGCVYNLVLINNLNPVKICLFVLKNEEILNNATCIARVLDCICEQQMKQKDTNEVLSMKMHYLSAILRTCHKYLVERNEPVSQFIKYLLIGRETDGAQLNMDKYIRVTIRDFPYHDAALFQQLVRSLADQSNEPAALSCLVQVINGLHMATDEKICSTCGEAGAQKKCSACKLCNYCDQSCQKLHWFTHKKACKNLTAERKRCEVENKQQAENEEESQAKEDTKNGEKVHKGSEVEEIKTKKDVGKDTASEASKPEEVTQKEAKEGHHAKIKGDMKALSLDDITLSEDMKKMLKEHAGKIPLGCPFSGMGK